VHACQAVLECLRKNEELNRLFEQESWPPYATRFGLHVGEAVVGNIGSADRMNYTALGATINLAARLEGLSKNYGTQVLVSDAIKLRAESDVFRSVDQIRPKGFAESVRIHELLGRRDRSGEPVFCRRWNALYPSLWSDAPVAALARLADYLAEYPEDSVAKYHFGRLRAAREQHGSPPASDIAI
jgi:adenylate cyclase